MTRYAQAREIIAWRYSECPNCEFQGACDKSSANLKLCFEEDLYNQQKDTVEGLLIKSLRFMVSLRRKQRREAQKKQTASKWSRTWKNLTTPKDRKATLYCADLKEYSEC